MSKAGMSQSGFALRRAGLVAPVLAQGARRRDVYLPGGAVWTDAWTGRRLKDGQTVVAAAPLERIPLYLRDGVRLPIHGPAR
jgi:alpha-D-xyloside xylohydrolase